MDIRDKQELGIIGKTVELSAQELIVLKTLQNKMYADMIAPIEQVDENGRAYDRVVPFRKKSAEEMLNSFADVKALLVFIGKITGKTVGLDKASKNLFSEE